MTKLTPIFASEGTAAKLMDMSLTQFRALVSAGHLPGGREIAPGFVRWSVEELHLRINGHAADEAMSDVRW